MPEGDSCTILRTKQVLMVDIQLVVISEDNKLHKGSLKKVKELGALIMVEEDIDELIKEIRRRDKFDE